MILKRFNSNLIIKFQPNYLTQGVSLDLELLVDIEERNKELVIGEYDILNDSFYCVFTFEGLNYLFLKNKVIEITDSISIKYRVNYTDKELSYFEIFQENASLAKEEYKNYAKPLINPFDGYEDWEYVNFAYHLANYINRAKENPNTPLFPNQSDEIS